MPNDLPGETPLLHVQACKFCAGGSWWSGGLHQQMDGWRPGCTSNHDAHTLNTILNWQLAIDTYYELVSLSSLQPQELTININNSQLARRAILQPSSFEHDIPMASIRARLISSILLLVVFQDEVQTRFPAVVAALVIEQVPNEIPNVHLSKANPIIQSICDHQIIYRQRTSKDNRRNMSEPFTCDRPHRLFPGHTNACPRYHIPRSKHEKASGRSCSPGSSG